MNPGSVIVIPPPTTGLSLISTGGITITTTVPTATISGFTNASNGVILVDFIEEFGFVVGDTIQVSGIVEDVSSGGNSSEYSLNGEYTIKSLTETSIKVVEDTTNKNVYISHGNVVRSQDPNGDPIANLNLKKLGFVSGTTIGADGSKLVAEFSLKEESV